MMKVKVYWVRLIVYGQNRAAFVPWHLRPVSSLKGDTRMETMVALGKSSQATAYVHRSDDEGGSLKCMRRSAVSPDVHPNMFIPLRNQLRWSEELGEYRVDEVDKAR
jgi:hypothetical protein